MNKREGVDDVSIERLCALAMAMSAAIMETRATNQAEERAKEDAILIANGMYVALGALLTGDEEEEVDYRAMAIKGRDFVAVCAIGFAADLIEREEELQGRRTGADD